MSGFAYVCHDEGADLYVHFPEIIMISGNEKTNNVLLTDFVPAQGQLRWSCQYRSADEGIGLIFNTQERKHSVQVNVGGVNYQAFPTQLEGISFIVRINKYNIIHAQYEQTQTVPITHHQQSLSYMHGLTISEYPHYTIPVDATFVVDRIEVALVKTSTSFRQSHFLPAGTIGEIGIMHVLKGNSILAEAQSHTIYHNALHFVEPTCKASDVYVTLPGQSTQMLQHKGLQFGQWQSFSIPIRQCPVSMKNLTYRLLRPASGLLDETHQIIQPKTGLDFAKGIGLQIADENQQLIQYGQYRVYKTNGQQQFDLPLMVRYAKPAGGHILPGRVAASVLFELDYD